MPVRPPVPARDAGVPVLGDRANRDQRARATGPLPAARRGGRVTGMAGKRLGIGVIGAGRWAGWAHLPGWARDPRCRIVGGCDIDPGRAAAAAGRYGPGGAPRGYTHPPKRDDIDILDVVTRGNHP